MSSSTKTGVQATRTAPTILPAPRVDFVLPPELEAHEPPEARGLSRDGVRLLLGRGDGSGDGPANEVAHHSFVDLPRLLEPGDVVVVNRSGTRPAAVDLPPGPDGTGTGERRSVHFSTLAADGSWLVELRRGDGPDPGGRPGQRVDLPGDRQGGAALVLRERHRSGRLWHAVPILPSGVPDVPAYLARHGRPIRYGYVGREWPLHAYQTAFATTPGSAEMPSAGRPFTPEVVTELVARGILVVPITLHTGVASAEFHEPPYAEWFEVPAATAAVVNDANRRGARVVAVGTTVVRALESAAHGPWVRGASGWTELVITAERGVAVVSGLLTGFHEPQASHLLMLEAIAGPDLVRQCYSAAVDGGYLWHEFGDVNLLLP
ncbi:S-adenosylmethionine:tRNA ribosyltransferase-isomerase [Actinopolymorpha cephalotaxi]|uniref:S-adenosylmethionine:tRNA ribosyltransferase-isomerase n=1 Tax=Actinopolymorpha cephalotaxi TaxID=504797 RepID=A0A1I2R0I1_9ACTN|nr:S-adenosylmethionine:tRNA ribosyltransferase-isomerase [Actinopolymorpha cephalotaxi]NYH82505.1 S-adenosylmethionine:tRNA ribosyltransferase-isomerase [Actinopolymorpha cephalotaxi]SFG31376.1 S-adenosylmethionine:tRNA ribosyltransferase-isomerase [Actinopolymorpha cephalotaxi]